LKTGVPITLSASYEITFTNEQNAGDASDTKPPVIAVRKNSRNTSFYIGNIEKLDVQIKWLADGALSGTKYPIAIGFGDIDKGQECWVSNSTIESSNSYYNNVYWWGSKLSRDTSASSWTKFAGEESRVVSDDPEARAIVGTHKAEGGTMHFKFVTKTINISYFSANFIPGPLPWDDEIILDNSTLTYHTRNAENTHTGKWAADTKEASLRGTSSNYKQTGLIYTEIFDVTENKIGIEVTETGSSISITRFDGWTDADGNAMFDAAGKRVCNWSFQNGKENEDAYASYVTDTVPLPDAGIESAAADMGMSGGYNYRTTALTAIPGGTVKREGTDVIFSVWVVEGGPKI
jgi:hypothetical protein